LSRRLTPREVVAVLSRNGFVLVSQRGSHQKWRHPSFRRQVIVPMHAGDLPTGTLRSIKRQSGLPESAWDDA